MDDYAIVTAMTRCGGSFAKALAEAWRCADYENQRRLKAAFDDYWQKYERLALDAQQQKEQV